MRFNKETFRKRLDGQLNRLPHTELPLSAADRNPQSILLINDDREFLRAAYRSILGRECDPAGFLSYLEALRRHIPRRVILSRIAQSQEAQSKPGSSVSFWASRGLSEGGRPNAFLPRLRAKLLSLTVGLVKRVFLSRFDAIDNRLMFLFEEVSASNVSLSKKIDDSLGTVSEKFDAYVSHLHSLQKSTQDDIAGEKHAPIERLKVAQSDVRSQIAALGSELEAIQAEMRPQNSAVASLTAAIDDLRKRMDAIDRAVWTTVDAMRQITADLGAEIEQKLDGISIAQRDAMKGGTAAVSAAAKELRLRMEATDRAIADSINTIQRSGIRIVQVDDFILGVPAEEWRLAAYLRFHGIPEPGLVKFFRGLIRPGMTIVDVGASLGIFTLYAVKSLQGDGRVHSFEPTPRTYGLLRSNVQVNGFLESGLVRFYETAVTDSEGTAQLTTFAENSGHNTLFWQYARAESVVVKTTRLDTALQSEPRVDVVKIDAEGAELGILRGMKATIENNPEIHILIEFAPIHLARANVTPEEFLEALRKLELEVSVVDDVTGALRTVPNQELVKAFSANLYLHRRIATPGNTP